MERKNGYVVDLPYAALAPAEMSPISIKAMAGLSGVALPSEDKLSYLELGFGRGLSLNIAAAATGARIAGVDFNDAHVKEAAGMAKASGAKLDLSDASLIEYAAKGGKPDKDIIALHGVWSWVDDETRNAIATILKTRLKPGGVALISYNVSAGWSAIQPLREFFIRYAEATGERALDAMTGGVEAAEALASAGARYFQNSPQALKQVKSMRGQGLRYLVHEYLNEGYRTSSFAELADALEGSGLTYIGPSRSGERLERQSLPDAPENKAAADLRFAETAVELRLGARFRSDLYVKGEAGDAVDISDQRYAITGMADQPPKVDQSVDPRFANLMGRVWQALASDGVSPKRHADIVSACDGAPSHRVTLALTALTSRNVVAACRAEDAPDREASARALNAALCERTASERESQALASPLIGGPVEVAALGQLFLLAEMQDAGDPVEFVRAKIADGQTPPSMAGDAGRIDPDVIQRHYKFFEERGRRRLTRLGVAPPRE